MAEVSQFFRNKDIKCCIMVKNYGGRKVGQIVHQTKEVVDGLIIEKLAKARPVGFKAGDSFEEESEDGSSISSSKGGPSLGDHEDDVSAGSDEVPDGVFDEPVKKKGDKYSEMNWNELRSAASEAGIELHKATKESLLEQLRAK